MIIEINQEEFTFIQDRYNIVVDQTLVYKAKSVPFSFFSKIKILDLNNKEVGTITKEFNFPKIQFPEYTLSFGVYSACRMQTRSFTHYQLYATQGMIDIYEQKNRRLGIFLKDLQIGLVDKNKKVRFGGDKYLIKIDKSSIEKELIIAFVLAYDNFYNSDQDSMLHYDFGNIFIKPEKEVDPEWEPPETL